MQWKWFAPLTLFVGLSAPMHADILNYTFTTSGAGSLDGTSFGGPHSSAGVALTMTANSANVTAVGNTFFITGPVTVSVDGVGSDIVTDTITIDDPPNQVFGLYDSTTNTALNLFNRNACITCAPYNLLAGPYGPVGFEIFAFGLTMHTVHGSLILGPSDPYQSNYASFQIIAANVASTPEPSSFILLLSGAIGLLTVVRRRS